MGSRAASLSSSGSGGSAQSSAPRKYRRTRERIHANASSWLAKSPPADGVVDGREPLLQDKIEHGRGSSVHIHMLPHCGRIDEHGPMVHVGLDGTQPRLRAGEDVREGVVHVGQVGVAIHVESLEDGLLQQGVGRKTRERNRSRSGREAMSSGRPIQNPSSMGISPRVIRSTNPESQTTRDAGPVSIGFAYFGASSGKSPINSGGSCRGWSARHLGFPASTIAWSCGHLLRPLAPDATSSIACMSPTMAHVGGAIQCILLSEPRWKRRKQRATCNMPDEMLHGSS